MSMFVIYLYFHVLGVQQLLFVSSVLFILLVLFAMFLLCMSSFCFLSHLVSIPRTE